MLRDYSPEIECDPYLEELAKLRGLRLEHLKPREIADLDVVHIDFLKLAHEIDLVELGFVPETDELIKIARVILQIQRHAYLSVEQMFEEAMELFG